MQSGVRIGSLVAAASLAGVIVLLSPAAPRAFAAAGTFIYTGGDGTMKTSANPPSDACLKVVGSGPVQNNTNDAVILYNAPDCTRANRIMTVGARSVEKNVPTFQALQWISDS